MGRHGIFLNFLGTSAGVAEVTRQCNHSCLEAPANPQERQIFHPGKSAQLHQLLKASSSKTAGDTQCIRDFVRYVQLPFRNLTDASQARAASSKALKIEMYAS